jgi:iron complex transport system substrate-binding protein
VATALVLGCTSGAGSTPTTGAPTASTDAPLTDAQTPTPTTPTPSRTPVAPTFPLTLTDDEGTSVTLAEPPQRIVSLTPAVTEELFALGIGDRIVGDTDADDYPAQAKALHHVATFQGVSIEQLVAAKPDLVVAGGNGFTPRDDVARIRGLGIPVVVIYAATVDGVLADLRLVGKAVGLLPATETLTDRLEARLTAIADAASGAESRPRTFYEIDHQPDIYGPADDSFVADMITRAGGAPITTGSTTSYTMPLERLVAADPQVIVLGDANYGATAAQVKGRGAPWSTMTAVKEGAVRPIDDIIVTRPGPRLGEGLAALAMAIHPDLVLPSATP